MRSSLLVFLSVRVAQALLMRTVFDPDEHWQSIEIAHRLVFGYGFATWEWQLDDALRSSLHPLLFAAPFALLRLFGVDSRFAVWLAPRLLQAVLAALTDAALFALATRVFSLAVARRTRWLLLCSWFAAFCLPRTYANCLEATLVLWALERWHAARPSRVVPLAIAALACLVRPTAVVYFVPMGVFELGVAYRSSAQRLWRFVAEVLVVGVAAVAVGVLVDTVAYAALWNAWSPLKLRFSLANFALFNVVNDAGALYGTHVWHWYLTNALPTMLLSFAPFLAVGLAVHRARDGAAGAPLWLPAAASLAVHSLLSHKEFRFVLPAMLCLLPYCAVGVAFVVDRMPRPRRALVWSAVLGLQIPVALYFGLVHQRAPLSVIYRIGALHDASCGGALDVPCLDSVDFLTPCHSTPLYAYTHVPPDQLRLRILQCAPPLSPRDTAPSEDERFFADPLAYLERTYDSSDADGGGEFESAAASVFLAQDGARSRRHGGPLRRWMPAGMVFFQPVLESADVLLWLEEHHYALAECFFHAHVPVDSRHGHQMCLFLLDFDEANNATA
jgi:phosphatidylinositol glycan class B